MALDFKYEEDDVQLSVYAKALAHPARITILKILGENDAYTCGEIVRELSLSQSTVSQHLQELKNAGLVTMREVGTKSEYSLKLKGVGKAEKLFKKLFKLIE